MASDSTTQSLTMMSALAVRGAFENTILPAFEAETGIAVQVLWAPTTVIMSRIAAGERADVVVVIAEAMDSLVAQGAVEPASRAELARSMLGLAVAPGAPHPDVGSLEAFTRALLEARSVAYSRGGASGIYFRSLIDRLGIAEAINAKATTIPAGFTAEKLLTGEADLAVQQVSELMVVPGVEIIGRFPDAVQEVSAFSAARMPGGAGAADAGRLLAHLAAPRFAAAYRASGVDPVHAEG